VKAELEAERNQLLAHWTKRLDLSRGLAFAQVRRILACSNGVVFEGPQALLGDDLRHFHDKLGYMSKLTVAHGGLCAGTIFRTDRFINEKERIGSKRGQTVHVEHTFPIKELRAEIGKRNFRSYLDLLSWLLKYSIATAFHECERESTSAEYLAIRTLSISLQRNT
jgi:hypothetical protein